jgi:PAS domain S-box-containing protein
MDGPAMNDRSSKAPAASLFSLNSDAWLAAIVEASDDAIVGKTLDGVIRSWNSGAQRIFEYAPKEIIGHSVLELIPPELQHEETEIVERLSRGERVEHFETIRLRRDGTRVEVSLSVSPICDSAGRVVGAAKIARDITEQNRLRQAERELVEELQQTATELEQQVEEAQALQDELEQSNEDLARSLRESESARNDAEHARQDADHARGDAENARREAEAANAAKSQFLATMSHELRTPLNAIAGYVDLLEMGLRGPVTPEQQFDFGRIKRSQETLLRLIDDVLNFAKLESGRLEYDFEDVSLDDFLGTLEMFVSPMLGRKKLTYALDGCGSNIILAIDRAKIEQILLNLLSNAVKFTDTGEIRVTCELEDDHVRIRVRDTGRGIRPELLDRIFEPFVQGDRSLTRTAEGTGLGLSISRQLSRAMGGDILVESRVGDGSVFTLVLPRKRGS